VTSRLSRPTLTQKAVVGPKLSAILTETWVGPIKGLMSPAIIIPGGL
jgi:hypothetical protein